MQCCSWFISEIVSESNESLRVNFNNDKVFRLSITLPVMVGWQLFKNGLTIVQTNKLKLNDNFLFLRNSIENVAFCLKVLLKVWNEINLEK